MIRILTVACLVSCLLLLKPYNGQAQISGQLDPCPFGGIFIGTHGGSEYVVLPITRGSASGWVDGNYAINLELYGTFTSISGLCAWEDVNNVTDYGVTAYGSVPGIVANITSIPSVSMLDGVTPVPRPTTADIQGSISALTGVRPYPTLLTFLRLTFEDPTLPIECYWAILPVTFTSVNATLNSSNQAVITWTTDHENDINHFTIQKKNAYNDWKKIAEVLPGSGPTGSYSWTDPVATLNPIYRVVEVSNSCTKTYSAQRSLTSTGTQNFNAIAPDCNTYIVGSDVLCGTSKRLYYLKYLHGDLSVTWTVSPANLGTVQGNGPTSSFIPSSTETGTGTLTATIHLGGGLTEEYTKTIRVNTIEDCTPSIVGPDAVCGTGSQTYTFNNPYGYGSVTWAVAPSVAATGQTVGQHFVITPGLPYNARPERIAATLTRNGTSTTYYKYIMVGQPELNVSSSTYSVGGGSYVQLVSVDPVSSQFPNSFDWYENNVYLHNGLEYAFAFTASNPRHYKIVYNGLCGPSVYEDVTSPFMLYAPYVVSPNPARGGNISLHKGTPSTKLPAVTSSATRSVTEATTRSITPTKPATSTPASTTVEIRIFDQVGRLRKTARLTTSGSKLNINAPELPDGLYLVHVIEQGRKPIVLKVWIEK